MNNAKEKTAHTPGPWEIRWYECKVDKHDVAAGSTKKVGDVLWRVPTSIGPIDPEHCHWAGTHLSMNESDALLASLAPELLEACLRLIGGLSVMVSDPDNEGDIVFARAVIAKCGGAA